MNKFRVYIFEPHTDPQLSKTIQRLEENYYAYYNFIIQDSSWANYISSNEIFFIDFSKTKKYEINKWRKSNQINKNILFKNSIVSLSKKMIFLLIPLSFLYYGKKIKKN